jgi:hypothetical protein
MVAYDMAMTKLLLFLLLNDVNARRHSQAFPLFKISTAGITAAQPCPSVGARLISDMFL